MGQHYVARFYLKAWSDNGEIYYLNLKRGTIVRRGLKGIANEKLFYRLHDLKKEELQFVERVAIDPSPEGLQAVQRNFINLFCLPPQMKKQVDGLQIDSHMRAALDDVIATAAENYHSRIENRLKSFLDSMLGGKIEFYSDRKQAGDFLYAICVQFMRTKRAREAALSRFGTTYNGCDVERVWSLLSHIYATSVGRSLYVERDKFKLLLVDNDTATPFITTDQPIINMHVSEAGASPAKLEFFYPLSPRKAMLLVETENNSHNESSLTEIAVNGYNVLMMKNSHEQVFSNSAEYLETIRKTYTTLP